MHKPQVWIKYNRKFRLNITASLANTHSDMYYHYFNCRQTTVSHVSKFQMNGLSSLIAKELHTFPIVETKVECNK